jgi:hypothetical protein
MTTLNLRQKIVNFLEEREEQKFTAREIAEWIFKTFPKECQAKKENSSNINTDDELVRQLAAEVGSNRTSIQESCPDLKTTEGRPRKFYFSKKSDSAEVAAVESVGVASVSEKETRIGEHSLYPKLSSYLWKELNVYPKRIDEKRSANRHGPNGNHWLYPDLVGMEDLGKDWHQEVKDCVNQYSDKRTKLWSFEVKRLINRSNVRECFFQSVSNSSWANFGYLVAAEIEGPDTLKELRMLFAAHGIGLIQLDIENPSESQVLIPSRERSEIDWDTANRLAEENKDFLKYVKLVKQFYQTGEAQLKDWDVPAEDDE